jgi:hypothetical protein
MASLHSWSTALPVSSGPQLNLSKTIAFAVGSLAVGVLLIVLVVTLAGSGDVQFKLGDDVFEVGDADRFAERIEDDATPLIFPSLSRSRPLFISHVGNDVSSGWFAIDARSPSDPEGCTTGLEWDLTLQQFRDSCDPARTFAPDGNGLLQYDIEVNVDGILIVDLNQDEANR